MSKVVTYPKLRVAMALNGDTQSDLAKLLKVAKPTITRKFDGTVKFTPEQIKALCKYYQKTEKQLGL